MAYQPAEPGSCVSRAVMMCQGTVSVRSGSILYGGATSVSDLGVGQYSIGIDSAVGLPNGNFVGMCQSGLNTTSSYYTVVDYIYANSNSSTSFRVGVRRYQGTAYDPYVFTAMAFHDSGRLIWNKTPLITKSGQFQTSATAAWEAVGIDHSTSSALYPFRGQIGHFWFEYTSGTSFTGDLQIAWVHANVLDSNLNNANSYLGPYIQPSANIISDPGWDPSFTIGGNVATMYDLFNVYQRPADAMWRQTDPYFGSTYVSAPTAANIDDPGADLRTGFGLKPVFEQTNFSGGWNVQAQGLGTPSSSTGLTTIVSSAPINPAVFHFETSGGTNKTQWLRSPTVRLSGLPSLHFYLGRYGATIGTLNVYWKGISDTTSHLNWNQNGTPAMRSRTTDYGHYSIIDYGIGYQQPYFAAPTRFAKYTEVFDCAAVFSARESGQSLYDNLYVFTAGSAPSATPSLNTPGRTLFRFSGRGVNDAPYAGAVMAI